MNQEYVIPLDREHRWVCADLLAGNERDTVIDDVGDAYERIWGGEPVDRWEKTEQVMRLDEGPFLVLYGDNRPLGYDLSYRFEPDTLDAMGGPDSYPEAMQEAAASCEEAGIDAAYVYHLAVDPDVQQQFYGLQAPTIRETRLEDGWETAPGTVYEELTGEAFSADIPVRDDDPVDAVFSLVRRGTQDEPAQVYRISRSFGFEETGIHVAGGRHTYALMVKTRPGVDAPFDPDGGTGNL